MLPSCSGCRRKIEVTHTYTHVNPRCPRSLTSLLTHTQEELERRAVQLQRAADDDARRHGPRRQAALARALAEWRSSDERQTAALRAQRERLPAWALRDKVVEVVGKNQVRRF